MKPTGSKRKFSILTTASDTTTVLNRNNYFNDIVLTGSGVLQVYDLGNATTYTPGRWWWEFHNNSTEFVGVVNSSGTVWHRVPPRARCVCILVSNVTAAGVWYSEVIQNTDPAYGLEMFEDFIGQSTTTLFYSSGWVNVVSGAGTTVSTNAVACRAEPGKQGIALWNTGTTAAGYALSYSTAAANSSFLGSGCRAYESLQNLYQLSVAAQEFIVRHGFGDNITGGAHTNGCYFIYDRLTWGDVWVCRNINGAGNTTVATLIVPVVSTTGVDWQKLRVEINSGATRADYWIDNVQVSPVGGLANVPLPATAGVRNVNIGITKSVGITACYCMADYIRTQSFGTALR